jgi:hypothetical protein
VIHKEGFEGIHQVHRCELEPNGTFYVEGIEPTLADNRLNELMQRLEALQAQVAALRGQAPQGA